MALSVGIVGLPNVGKSTLFNTLTKSMAAEASNYPFCTIDPNVGVVEVPDDRLYKLAETAHSAKIVPAVVEFVDVAGLVKGASEGEGLGNKFLANIRETAAIGQVVRVFEDPNVTHVHGTVDPKSDIAVVNAELILADMKTVDRRLHEVKSAAKSGEKQAVAEAAVVEKLAAGLGSGKLARECVTDDERDIVYDLHLLTMKPFLYIANIDEKHIASVTVDDLKKKLGVEHVIPLCAKVESELALLPEQEQREFLASYGLHDSGLVRLIREAYDTLGLQSYFTAGEQEARAWTVKKGATAPQAAGVIHTDFEKGFIKAEVCSWEEFIRHGGWAGVREAGKLRLEGKEYIVQEGDVMVFKFSN